jgi:hypothetical protein
MGDAGFGPRMSDAKPAHSPQSGRPKLPQAERPPPPEKPPLAESPLHAAANAIRSPSDRVRTLEPVQADEPEVFEPRWTGRLVLFLRVMAVLSMAKGLYHWAVVSGVAGPLDGFEYQPTPWQTATVFFAVIDLVAAVGLWLAAAWGAVVWLTACVSMAAVEVFFPQVYGGRLIVVGIEGLLLFAYLALAIQSAREHPN